GRARVRWRARLARPGPRPPGRKSRSGEAADWPARSCHRAAGWARGPGGRTGLAGDDRSAPQLRAISLIITMRSQKMPPGIDLPAARTNQAWPDGGRRAAAWRRHHAGTGTHRPALHARSGRAARDSGARCDRLPRAVRVGTRRAAGSWGVLHPQRLPDHRPAAGALVGPGHAGPERLLAAAGP